VKAETSQSGIASSIPKVFDWHVPTADPDARPDAERIKSELAGIALA